jgi:hypothetical protein
LPAVHHVVGPCVEEAAPFAIMHPAAYLDHRRNRS